MTQRTVTVLSLVLLAAAAAGDPAGAVFAATTAGSGRSATQVRDVAPFSRVRLDASVDARIEVGPAQSVTLEGDDNLLAYVRTEVSGEELVVSYEGEYRSRMGLEAKITVPRLVALRIDGSGDAAVTGLSGPSFSVSVSGSGDVSAKGSADEFSIDVKGSGSVALDGLAARAVDVQLNGSGDVALRGTAERLNLRVNGSGDVDAGGLQVRTASVNLHGSGDARLNVQEELTARLHGSGDLHYGGTPRVELQRQGSGDAIRH